MTVFDAIVVLGLEAQPAVGHALGSSHGLTRIIRLSYFEHPSYVPLLRHSFRLWRELEAAAGQRLLTVTGCLNISTPAALAADEPSCFEGALASARQHGLAHEVLGVEAAAARFPALRLPPGTRVLHEPEGGMLAPEAAICAAVARAQALGARVELGCPVERWEAREAAEAESGAAGQQGAAAQSPAGGGGGPAVVHTPRGAFAGRRLVLAAGGWMPALVPELGPLLQVERQVVGWFGVEAGAAAAFAPSRLPVFLLDGEAGYYYGKQIEGGACAPVGSPQHARGLARVVAQPSSAAVAAGALRRRGEVTTADSVDREVHPEDEAALREVRAGGVGGRLARASREGLPVLAGAGTQASAPSLPQCVAAHFPGADGALARASACTFTNTPDGHFLLDLHPRHGNQVVLCSACSGHGFKFAPVIGEVLADLAVAGATPHDISLHRLSPARPGHAALLARFEGGAALAAQPAALA
eukprot:scaffold30.g4458.t1